MWSDRYYYLNIYSDEELTKTCDTRSLRQFLQSLPELTQVGDFNSENSHNFPFTRLILLHTSGKGGWNDSHVSAKRTNLIDIVCAKGEDVPFDCMSATFIKIAKFLNWKLIDELTDDDVENFVIWEPEL